ncbi:MAG TPA: hypothetical protein VHJ34_05765 [Actinomycetota bacterium]|nr:hypothetical protein [Actinomycetota bacterium]
MATSPDRKRPRARTRRRARAALALTGVAVVAVLVVTDGTSPVRPPTGTRHDGIRLVAARSEDAYSTSGRATVSFATRFDGGATEGGTSHVEFSGDDVAMTTEFRFGDGTPGFVARSRTVDGELYLWDGPIGDRRWYVDLNASGARAEDVFDLDPRELLGLLDASADFEEVSSDTGVRRLRATRLDGLPALAVDFWPREDDVTRLEVWVGPDDVVRRLELDVVRVDRHRSGTKIVPFDDGTPGRKIHDPDSPLVTSVTHSSYSVRFFDVGADVDVVAPADAIPVRGQG